MLLLENYELSVSKEKSKQQCEVLVKHTAIHCKNLPSDQEIILYLKNIVALVLIINELTKGGFFDLIQVNGTCLVLTSILSLFASTSLDITDCL